MCQGTWETPVKDAKLLGRVWDEAVWDKDEAVVEVLLCRSVYVKTGNF
jgi:hypothetical protein